MRDHDLKRRGLLHALLPALLTAACIDTDVPASPALAFCIQRAPADEEPIVVVGADLGSLGYIECSGVLVSPKVVLTHLGCLVLPDHLYGEVPPEVEEPALGSRSFFPSEADYRGLCANDSSWQLLEDGSFAGRLEESVALSSLQVSPVEDASGLEAVGVRSVFTSGAVSRCADGLAALVLDSELALGRPTVRLTNRTNAGEPVTLRGFTSEGAAQIERVTFELGDATTPPRAFAMRQPTCLSDLGGGVFSASSNALIGIIELGVTDACDDPAGETIALQLAPFRNLLLAAANDARETLYVEPDPGAIELRSVPDCLPP